MRRLKISVRDVEITQGRPRYSAYCPVALALTNSGYKHVVVGPYTASFYVETPGTPALERFDVTHSYMVEKWIQNYDKHGTAQPCELAVEDKLMYMLE